MRFALGIAVLVLVFHHFFVDRPLGLEPASRWALYRFGMSLLCIAGVAATFTRLAEGPGLRFIGAVAGAALSYFQARSMVWSTTVPYLYAVLIPVVVTLVLQLSPLRSSLYLAALFGLAMPSFRAAAVEPRHLLSALAVAFAGVNLFRARMATDVRAFISEQERLQTEKRLIEVEIELSREVRAFLPREIYERTLEAIHRQETTVAEALEDALRPRLKVVACVFSDIRGFTERSKDLTGYLVESALPNIRSCTELVEAHRGIPRLVGDLVFGYFDARSPEENICDALACAVQLVRKNAELNRRENLPAVKRHVLLSFGDAVVGNIGGHDSSREITALGSPVNILSRIDALTKDPKLAPHLPPDCVIVTGAAAAVLRGCFPELRLERVDLRALQVELRDFPEEEALWLVLLGTDDIGSHARTIVPGGPSGLPARKR